MKTLLVVVVLEGYIPPHLFDSFQKPGRKHFVLVGCTEVCPLSASCGSMVERLRRHKISCLLKLPMFRYSCIFWRSSNVGEPILNNNYDHYLDMIAEITNPWQSWIRWFNWLIKNILEKTRYLRRIKKKIDNKKQATKENT